MKRRDFVMLSGAALLMPQTVGRTHSPAESAPATPAQPTPQDLDNVLPDQLLLKDYRPRSIYKIPVTEVKRAKFPAIDMHHHVRPQSEADVEAELRAMDAANIERATAFTGSTGQKFDELARMYLKHPDRFDVYCHLDMTGCDQPGWEPTKTVKELVRCHEVGAVGLGELHDKGMGIGGQLPRPTGPNAHLRPVGPRQGLHPHDDRMDAIWQTASRLGMVVNLHMSDPIWSYLKQDRYNDGLMNGFTWRLDDKPGIMGHEELIQSYERTLAKHPKTVFVSSHMANLDYDLERLGAMFDKYPNLYADISARFHELAPIPRAVNRFLAKHADRVTYATDMPLTEEILSLTFRILESDDEHFYDQDVYFNFNYHWPMHGFALPDDILEKVYRGAALKAYAQARANAG